jgi:predicted pyridoxine 5'-phosphate oxidase superfamily flavin-nucleotide-binding protein
MGENMSSTHPGEQVVQRQAGEGAPGWGSPMFDAEIPWSFAAFLQGMPALFIAAPDSTGAMWSTIVSGPPGFVTALDARNIEIAAVPAPGDALDGALTATPTDIGIVAVDFERRRRIRINGTVTRAGNFLHVETTQVLGNCPKYINRRSALPAADTSDRVAPPPSRSRSLSEQDMTLIAEADTFFIGSRSPAHGADSSHRGGRPGFVTAESPTLITWPDYVGNSFYMTFGNAHLDARCGLLFLDWLSGDLLQMTGTLSLDWRPESIRHVPGALRLVRFDITEVVRVPGGSPLSWRRLDG